MKPMRFVLLCTVATSLLLAGCFGNRDVSEAAPVPLRSPHPTFTPTPMQPPTPTPPLTAAVTAPEWQPLSPRRQQMRPPLPLSLQTPHRQRLLSSAMI
jgi:hypothetical protein